MEDPKQIIRRNFTHQEPDEYQKAIIMLLEAEYMHLSEQISEKVADSRERSLAIARLEEAKFWTMSAIVRH